MHYAFNARLTHFQTANTSSPATYELNYIIMFWIQLIIADISELNIVFAHVFSIYSAGFCKS